MRDSQGRFLPGHSGNIKGRGVKGSAVRDMLNELLYEKSVYKKDVTRIKNILLKAISQAEGGCKDARNFVFDRYEGKCAITVYQETKEYDSLQVVDGDCDSIDGEEVRIVE